MPKKGQSYPDHDDTLLISIYDKHNVNGKQWAKIWPEYNEKMTGRGEWTKEQVKARVNHIKFIKRQRAQQIVTREEQIIVPSTSAGNPSSQQAAVVSKVSTPLQFAPMNLTIPSTSTGYSSDQQTVVVTEKSTPMQYAVVNTEENNGEAENGKLSTPGMIM